MAEQADYDPHKNRNMPHATTNTETLIHLLKGAFGTGILAMPQAFNYAGWLGGLIGIFTCAILCVWGMHVLVKGQYVLCQRKRVPLLNYTDSVKESFETGPRIFRPFAGFIGDVVNFFLCVYQFGILTVYVLFVAENIKGVYEGLHGDEYAVQYYCLVIAPFFILLMLIRNLKLLAPFSQAANVITAIGIACTLYYMLSDPPPLSDREVFGDIGHYALFFGTALFALEAVGVITSVENNMKTPSGFGGTCGVLNISMLVVSIIYAIFGCLGYIKYGPDAEGSVTLNLPKDETLSQIIKGLFALAVFQSYALQGYPLIIIVCEDYLYKYFSENKYCLVEIIFRMVIVLLSFILAMSVPRIGLMISLAGSFSLPTLGFFFPALLDICVHWPDMGKLYFRVWQDLILIVVGLVGFGIGSVTAIMNIIDSFQ